MELLGGKYHSVFKVLSDNQRTDSDVTYLIVRDMDNKEIYKKVVFQKNCLLWLLEIDDNGEPTVHPLTATERKRYTRRILKAVKTYHHDHYLEMLRDPNVILIR